MVFIFRWSVVDNYFWMLIIIIRRNYRSLQFLRNFLMILLAIIAISLIMNLVCGMVNIHGLISILTATVLDLLILTLSLTCNFLLVNRKVLQLINSMILILIS